MRIIGKSIIEGAMVQCEACHTVYAQNKYESCPHCWLRDIAFRAGKERGQQKEYVRRKSYE